MPRALGSKSALRRRLAEERDAVADSTEMLRHRVCHRLEGLTPRRQMQLHSGAALVTAAILGLAAGRLAGGILHLFLRQR